MLIYQHSVLTTAALRAEPEPGTKGLTPWLGPCTFPQVKSRVHHPAGTVGTENSNYEPPTDMYLNGYARAYTRT